MPGKLFIVGTPIGNMEDITLRALRVLREADLIAAEDTRHTARLLTRHGISKPLVSYHQFNEAKRTPELLEKLHQGRTIALVSDAGMPTISDPGQRLIQGVLDYNAAVPPSSLVGRDRRARRSPPPNTEPGTVNREPPISLEIIPGPSAITMALAASGLSSPFFFYGFLPHKSSQRRNALSRLAPLPYTLVFFESPYRLLKSLRDMHELLGNRQAVVARELTKKFEEIIRGDLATILKKLENRSIKGEITVVIEGHHE